VSQETMPGTSDSTPMRRRLAALALGAIGVVLRRHRHQPAVHLADHADPRRHAADAGKHLGVLSLIFWALILVVSLKYVVFIMRADNKGEGGIMALMALAQRSVREQPKLRWVLAILGIFGASLFYGDGVITPAISVLSAVEGVKVAAPQSARWVVPMTW
jgi:KUP system potassium uptake protein